MNFRTPRGDGEFEIPDGWWEFARPERERDEHETYFPHSSRAKNVHIVKLSEIEPPTRDAGEIWFRKYKLVPVLLSFQSPECELPPIELTTLNGSVYNYKVHNGFHRYYASVAVGYEFLPAILWS